MYPRILFIFLIILAGCDSVSQDNDSKQLNKAMIQRGRELYLGNGCAVCHGKEGRGDGLTAKQYYPPPINLHDAKAYKKGNTVNAMARSIRKGSQNTEIAMPAFDHLTRKELYDIATYLKSLQLEVEVTDNPKRSP